MVVHVYRGLVAIIGDTTGPDPSIAAAELARQLSGGSRVDRKIAKKIICKHKALTLECNARKSILDEWWSLDKDSEIFMSLPSRLQLEMTKFDLPQQDIMDSLYDSLIIEGLCYELFGVTNEYLANSVSTIQNMSCGVTGKSEQALSCPCCRYHTLRVRGEYNICPVCFWEDDGCDEILKYSFPNHMTLAQGQENYKKWGVVEKEAKVYIHSDVSSRYYHDD